MFKVIHPNRWFFWTIAFLVACGLFLLSAIHQTSLELDELTAELAFPASSGWKVFHSAEMGFEIRYPATWQVESDRLDATLTFHNPKNFSENLSLAVTEPKYQKMIRDSLVIKSEREVLIDGYKGTLIDEKTTSVVLIIANQKLYYLAGETSLFEKILKSIRFVSPSPQKSK